MTKLIMTDIDGTLLEESHTDLNPEYFDVIRALTEHGVQVCVASGRHGVSVKKTFAPVLDCIWIVSQNGCVIEHQGKTQVVRPIPREWVEEFWHDLGHVDQAEGILDTATRTFCPFVNTPMYRIVKDNYQFDLEILDGWNHVPDIGQEEFSMMTMYHPGYAWDEIVASGIEQKWKDRLYIVSTGKTWVDCLMPGNNKGTALQIIAEQLGIAAEEVVAFGDNDNDVPMIRAAGIGYAVDTARPAALEAADQIIPGFKSDGVLTVMKQILADDGKRKSRENSSGVRERISNNFSSNIETESPDQDWLGKAPDINDSLVCETVNTDVLVVGCGVAGVAAVRSAAEAGAKVIAVEKAVGPQCRSGQYAVINGSVQHKWGRDTWTPELIDRIIKQHMEESNYRCKQSVFSRWANHCGEVFDWWIAANPSLYIAEKTRADIPDENAGNYLIPVCEPLPEAYHWEDEQFPCFPASVEFRPSQKVTVMKNMEAAIATGNVDARYGHFVEKLIMNNGRCVGAYVRNAADNTYIRVNACRGVILATGDYSQNESMVRHFTPSVIRNGIKRFFTNVDVEGNMTNDGSGIRLGMWAGALAEDDHAPMIHHMGGAANAAGIGVMGIAGFLNLDLNGRRFMNEDLPGQQIENQIEKLKGRQSWQIFDSNWPKQLPFMPAVHGGACFFEDYSSPLEGPKNNLINRNYKSPYQLDTAVKAGRAIKADTLEELVSLIYEKDEAAQKTALASIERYNDLCRKGFDEDFGKPSSRLFPLEKGPFYADKFTCALLLVICGGLESDENCHTFDADRNVIPGLYVAGNVQGGRFAHEYPITLRGVSHSMAMYYGYVAGKNAAST